MRHDAKSINVALTNLAVKLRRVSAQIRSTSSEGAKASAVAAERIELKKRVLEGANLEAGGVPERTKLIENRKEENERQQARRFSLERVFWNIDRTTEFSFSPPEFSPGGDGRVAPGVFSGFLE